MKVILLISSKIVCRGNVPWGIRNRGPERLSTIKYLPFGVKIGPADPEIVGLIAIFKNRNKLRKVKHITLNASLLSGLISKYMKNKRKLK